MTDEPAPVIALLTDFGLRDGYIGVLHGVIAGIAPHAQLIDLSHEVAAQDIAEGAWILHTAWRYFPPQTIFLCVVDPGVGTARRPIALQWGARYFVGPDNGLCTPMARAESPSHAVVLDNTAYHLPQISATFHGRDVFAPCAAHLACGVAITALGSPLALATITVLDQPPPQLHAGALVGHVIHIDRFGNLITDIAGARAIDALASPTLVARLRRRRVAAVATTFAEAPLGVPALLLDSSGHLAIAVRNGSAALTLGAQKGDEVRLSGVPTIALGEIGT